MRAAILALALTAIALNGCASLIEGTDSEATDDATCVSEWGTVKGSVAYVQCRAALSQRRAERQRRNMEAARAAAYGSTAPAPSYGGGTMCMKQSERLSGMNRICNYSCAGSGYAMTQPAAEFCPFSIQR